MVQRWIDQAVAAERERIAHDLHDSVGGLLTAAHLLSSDLAKRLPRADASHAARVASYTSGAMAQVRAACAGMVPPRDVATALANVAVEADSIDGVSCTARVAPGIRLPDGADGHELVLLVREAVTNALRHARARTITVSATPHAGGTLVEVLDDGIGVRPGPITGLGVATMTRRAGRLGASFSIGPARGGGTAVRVILPAPGS